MQPDYTSQFNKDVLRQLLDETPDIAANAELRRAISAMLQAQTINPVPYTYNAVYAVAGAANSLAAGVLNVPANVGIQSDADFMIMNQTYDCNSLNAARNAGTIVIPNATVLLNDTGSGMQQMDQAVSVPQIFGTGQQPYILPQPKYLMAKSTLQVLVSNFDAAAGYNLRLSFNGIKLFAY